MPVATSTICKMVELSSPTVFNIEGNKYRLVVWMNYPCRLIYVRFFGTHKQYDKIDVQTI